MFNSTDEAAYAPNVVWEPLPGSQTLALSCPAQITIFHGTRGPGKGQPLTEPVLCPSGWRPIGELRPGDTVCQPDGGVCFVDAVYPQGVRPCYEITFDDGATARCDDQHLWSLHLQNGDDCPMTTYPMSEVLRRHKTTKIRQHVPTLSVVAGSDLSLPVEPYLLGVLLGDGSFTQQGSFCTADEELAQEVLLWDFKEWFPDKRPRNKIVRNFGISEIIRVPCQQMGLWGKRSWEKVIPEIYLRASAAQRLALLQGLMDTDGTVNHRGGWISFASASEQLSKGVQILARSLGARASIRCKPVVVNGKKYRDCFNVCIQQGHKFAPFRLSRKLDKCKPYQWDTLWRRIEEIKEIEPQETVCIKLTNPNGLYITSDYVVTHNTDAQLMRFRRNVGQGYGKFWRGIIFDREYKNLDDLVAKSQRWFPEFKDGAKFHASKADYKWTWPTGEELMFRAVKKDSDYWGYHGQEFPFIGWNELTKYPNSNLFDMMMSCNRSSFLPENNRVEIYNWETEETELVIPPDMPLEVFATCNPHGAGHNWIKERFIDPAPMGKIQVKIVNVFNPRTQQREDVRKTQVHIFGSYRENRYLNPEYIAELETITDPNKRRAWLMGDWDVMAGGMFDAEWDKDINVIAPFNIPASWKVDRSFDYGSSRPFSVGWWAESDGTEFTMANGRVVQTVKGDLFRIGEWYGTNGKANTGLKMLADAIASGIVQREVQVLKIHSRVKPGPADNSIWDEDDGKSIAKTMEAPFKLNGKTYKGVHWKRSNKKSGSRKLGWEECRKMLADAKRPFYLDANGQPVYSPRERPGLFFFSTCPWSIKLFPTLPRDEEDPDDVDTESEDHIGDEVRYKVLDIRIATDSNIGSATSERR